jgi:hypothetical protein
MIIKRGFENKPHKISKIDRKTQVPNIKKNSN